MCAKVLFVFLAILESVLSSNILYISPMFSPSHHIWNKALVFGLVEKGHNVTLIGLNSDKKQPSNYTHILLEDIYHMLDENYDLEEFLSSSTLENMQEYKKWCLVICQKIMKGKGLEQLLNYPEEFRFDLIIIDPTAGSCLYPLIHKFNYPPAVAVTPFLLPPFLSFQFGNHLSPGYIPWYGFPFTSEMTFSERVWNLIFSYYDTKLRVVDLYGEEHQIAREVFGQNLPSMQELERHISLLLANCDPLLDYPQPMPPNIIPVGGLHVTNSKKLPEDLEAIVDKSSGIVVFSLGTNVRSDKLDKRTQKALLDAFSKIPQTVLWKFESDIEDLPENVFVSKWLPQNDLLGQSKTRLFIGHGGSLSTQEAMYHGVPMIAIPFFVDQHINAKRIVAKQLGLSISVRNITKENVLDSIVEVLENPIYKENMQTLSRRFRDQPQTPLERAIFWIEYTLRYGGAQFLSPQSRYMSFVQSSSTDVVLFLSALLGVFVLICYKIVLVCKKQQKSKQD